MPVGVHEHAVLKCILTMCPGTCMLDVKIGTFWSCNHVAFHESMSREFVGPIGMSLCRVRLAALVAGQSQYGSGMTVEQCGTVDSGWVQPQNTANTVPVIWDLRFVHRWALEAVSWDQLGSALSPCFASSLLLWWELWRYKRRAHRLHLGRPQVFQFSACSVACQHMPRMVAFARSTARRALWNPWKSDEAFSLQEVQTVQRRLQWTSWLTIMCNIGKRSLYKTST